MNRRQFVVGSAATVLAMSNGICEAQRSYYRQIPFKTHDFIPGHAKLIADAMDIVAARFLDPAMFQNADATYEKWDFAYPRPWQPPKDTAAFEKWFNTIQLRALLSNQFPQVNLWGVDHLKEPTAGQVAGKYLNSVRMYLENGTLYIRNSDRNRGPFFCIQLNRQMMAKKKYQNPAMWAGVIAHEMLHCMGHTHPPNKYDGWFITSYQAAVQFGGKYNPKNHGGFELVGSGGNLLGCGT